MRRHPQKASVALLALCCVAVIGIGLAGYLAVSNQSMKLSNRSYAVSASKQLAEMGLELALNSFNTNSYSGWTISGTTATRTINFSNTKFGNSGFTTSINIRIDNYGARTQDAIWNDSTNYRMDQFVLRSGGWYRAFAANKNSDPTLGLSWSVASGSATAAWNTGAYNVNDVVNRGGVWYRCIQAHTNQGPPNATYWSTAPLLSVAWSSGAYNLNDIVYHLGAWYRCTLAHATGQKPPNATYWASADSTSWSAATPYAVNDYISYGGIWYKCIQAHTNITPNNNAYWTAQIAPVIYAEGVVVMPDLAVSTIKTQLRAGLDGAPGISAPLFYNAAAATNTLTFNAGGTVDSYDSVSDPTAASPGFSAVLAGGNTSSTAVTVTSATVKGYIAAPFVTANPYSVGPTASLRNSDGSVTSPHPMATNVDLTRISSSPFIPQYTIPTPNSGTATALPASGALGTATDTTWRTYTSGALNITDSRTYTVNGPVRIIVTGNYYQNLSGGSATVIIANNSTAKLEMYISGDIAIYGGGFDNLTRLPKNLAIFASTSATAPDINTTTAFHGVIHFSHSSSRFNVLGNRTLFGALSGANLRFTGSPVLHYDTNLRYTSFAGVFAPYVIKEWRELTNPSERVTLP
jgi:hypothetical protein